MDFDKHYIIKIFNKDNSTFSSTINPILLKNAPKFKSRINGGYGECIIDLNLPFDDFGEGTTIDFMKIVKIYAIKVNTETKVQTSQMIYKGYVSGYEYYIDNSGDEGVRLNLLSGSTIMSYPYYKNGSSYTVSHTSDDPETIARACIDFFNTVFGGTLIAYSDDTTDPVGTTFTKDFIDQKCFDVLNEVHKISGDNWWYKIDEDWKYWLKPKPSTPTHIFTLGRDVDSVSSHKTSESVINDIQVRYSTGSYNDSDSTSQSKFGTGSTPAGKFSTIVSDTTYDATGAQRRAEKEIADKKDEKIRTQIVINNNYDIESIKVGETCSIRNYNKNASIFNDNMFIVGVSYNGDTVSIDIEEERFDLGRTLYSFVNS